jgi:AcrR family transcriptional regulator
LTRASPLPYRPVGFMDKRDSQTRGRILRAALKHFADCGYEGAAVQAIVDAARVTKPTLYYYFQSKAGLYQALIDWAHDERYRLMQEAAGRGDTLPRQLTEILAELFEFINGHRALMRIAFVTAFSARGELPGEIRYVEKCERNFEFIHSIVRRGLKAGALDRQFSSRELATALYGMMTIKVMEHLIHGKPRLRREDAESIVRLFLGGAAGKSSRRALQSL